MSPITYSGASCSRIASRARTSRLVRRRAIASTSKVCCATEKIWEPEVCPFQRATRARPCAMSAISTSSGEGSSSIVVRAPQHALPGARADCPFGRACPSCRHSIVVADSRSGGGESANLAHFDRIEGSRTARSGSRSAVRGYRALTVPTGLRVSLGLTGAGTNCEMAPWSIREFALATMQGCFAPRP